MVLAAPMLPACARVVRAPAPVFRAPSAVAAPITVATSDSLSRRSASSVSNATTSALISESLAETAARSAMPAW